MMMNGRGWVLVGFTESFVFPLLALWFVASSSASGLVFPLVVVGAIYPIGLLALVFFGIMLSASRQGYPESYIAFSRGARYAMMGIAAISIPILAIATFVLHQNAVAAGLLLIAVGATWLPSAPAAGAYARAIGDKIKIEGFVGQARKAPYSSEKIVMVFLSVYLGQFKSIKNFFEAGLWVLAQAGLYIFGWSILNSLGAYPSTLFGLAFLLVAPVTGYLLFRTGTSGESRRALSNMIENYRR